MFYVPLEVPLWHWQLCLYNIWPLLALKSMPAQFCIGKHIVFLQFLMDYVIWFEFDLLDANRVKLLLKLAKVTVPNRC